MYDLVVTALQTQQLNQAAQLLKQWQQKNRKIPGCIWRWGSTGKRKGS
ncbi:MAG: hypothetical protein HC929_09455 [Leptolyngbyaceae cyanobacterium SM2_5_2]|nr:hypothetical protein [Leptolyngbyaceae cyanobacterium SM2_5_2]